MSSQFSAIVTAVCAMSVSPITVVLRGSTMKNAIEIADSPCRIVSAIGMQSSRTKTKTLGGVGHVMSVEWQISDLALLRPAGLGFGLSDIVTDMETYLAAYHDAVRGLVNPTWYVADVRARAQVIEWPAASGRYFDSVAATLVVSEIVQ